MNTKMAFIIILTGVENKARSSPFPETHRQLPHLQTSSDCQLWHLSVGLHPTESVLLFQQQGHKFGVF